jgi:sensor histidine kinase YesM
MRLASDQLSREKLYWFMQLAVWLAYNIANVSLYIVAGTFGAASVLYGLILSIWFIFSTHIYRLLIRHFNWVNLKFLRLLPRVLLSTLILSVIKYFVHLIIADYFDFLYGNIFDPLTVAAFLFAYMIFYMTWSLLYFMYHYFERYNSALRYEAVKNEIELNKLKSQLNPHFIFNALNGIRGLVDEDPSKAKDAITQLSHILRSSLVMNKSKLTNFEEELHTVKDYLELEGIRFEERLKSEYHIDPLSRNFRVPPLMIQTLVENGIKHGVARLKDGGVISITTSVKNAYLTIQIRNSGQLVNGQVENDKGFGLDNTVQRLQLIYGRSAEFKIRNENSNTVITEVKIPEIYESTDH